MTFHHRTPTGRAPCHHRAWSITVALVVLALIAAACGSSADEAAEGGWLDGSPADVERDGGDAMDLSGADMDFAEALSVSDAMVDNMAEGATVDRDVEPPEVQGALRAGSVDDNADFAGYLAYRARIAELGIPIRELDVSVRHVVEVTGDDDRPVPGQPVQVLADGNPVGSVRTGADGRALVHPRTLGAGEGAAVELRVDDVTVAVEPDGPTAVRLDRPGGIDAPVPLDLYFVLDATGSMGGELARLTATVDDVVARVADLDARPDVRLGMTVYRDEGDEFVTRTYDFTSDVAAFQEALGEVRAAGGGDYPEALDEALAASLDEPAWRDPATTVQLAFVVADAPPQITRDVPKPYDVSLVEAAERGIRIHTVAASDTDDQAEYVFRQFAQFTGGRFVFLSFGAEGAAVGPSTDISALDYEELPLEELLLRLVAEELAPLTGDEVPPTTTAPTTVDPRQQQD